MLKYSINKELLEITKQKAPSNIKLYPLISFAMKYMFKCKTDDDVDVLQYEIAGYRDAKIKTYVIEPKGCKEILPCIVYFHGGGFILRASAAHYKIAKWYAQKVKCKIVYVDYRLAPKHPFPIPVEDCYSAYQWTILNADKLGIDKNKIGIGGDSAGGNLAASVTTMLKDRKEQLPVGAMLIYPVMDRRMKTESMKRYIDTPVWNAKLSKMMWKAYLKDTNADVKYASPMEAESLSFFPRTYIEVAEYDCLHDEGMDFSNRLQQEGVKVELHEEKGTCHGFEMALKSTILKNAMERRVNWLKEILYKY